MSRCTRPTKNRSVSDMCDVLLGGPRICDKSVTGRGGLKLAKNRVTVPFLLFHSLLRYYTISSRFPLFHYLFVTSMLFFRLRLVHLLFVTQLYYFLRFSLFCNLFLTSLLCFQLSPLLFVASLYLQVSNVSLSVCYVIALFSASIVQYSDWYVTILLLQYFQY